MPKGLIQSTPDRCTDTTKQTPIEIALGIDDQGRTTARKLYEFLELDRSHYNRWYKTNILNNKFAEENTDYWVFAPDGENLKGGRPTQDYKLTASFAKKLAMIASGEKGEAARDYFEKTEEALKQIVSKRNTELDQIKVHLFDLTAINTALAKRLDDMEKRQAVLEQKSVSAFSSSERAAMAECFTRVGKLLSGDVAPENRTTTDDPPLTAKQLEEVRAAIHKTVEWNIEQLDSDQFVLSSSLVSARQIIRSDIHSAIKKQIGVRHTQARQSMLDAIMWEANYHAISDEVRDRVYRFTNPYGVRVKK